MTETPATEKARQTRAAILDAALDLFRSHGYDGTTMRAVAQQAGVSAGNAYYYFSSKEHLVQAFYDQLQEAHAAAAAEALQGLEGRTAYSDRLRAVLSAWVDIASEYHEFAGTFFKNAAEPTSPLSPFSEASTPAREAAVQIHRATIDGSDLKVSKALREELPELMWLLQMGVVLFWVHDRSPDQRRTRELVERAVPLIDRLLRLTRVPVVRGVVDDVVGLVRSVKGP
ncbi:TetR family transcriptional regulator [Aeromicrobium sp. Root495]|uniref:TetR/AcrR family transcriptional regulator n=1 Tax=Aeromicrobium sp. Root495 TaxID=1736550 RepID=UPI0006F3E220|nr:TetR family transcriptional regulator [Aeromicrobium sp. Root495]KQY56096.1 TetR family transcriptional regulator [Aeromicrobium sp. Root495]RYJ07257.1 MAG: TetR/AcrR family transcriptional regulator [Actinomycetales bacterium]